MRYLLVGNAPNCTDAVAKKAEHADAVVQCNNCAYARMLPSVQHNYVFVTNTVRRPGTIRALEHRLTSLRSLPAFASTDIVLCRNPYAYALGRRIFRGRFDVYRRSSVLSRFWPVRTVSFASTVRLHMSLLKRGMEIRQVPSTGMVAYDWVRRRLQPGDSLLLVAFTHQGWQGHPWHLEREIMRPVTAGAR